MDLIREMINVLEENKPKSFNLLIPKNSKLRKLYQLVSSESPLTEKRISEILYKSNKGDKRFMMLKRNLILKLTELVLLRSHLDSDKWNYISVHLKWERQLTIAKKLLSLNVYHNAEKIAKNALKKSESYELIDIAWTSYTLLRKIYYLKGYPSEVEKYHALSVEKFELMAEMERAEGMLEVLLSQTKFIRSQSQKIVDTCDLFLSEIYGFKLFGRSSHLQILIIRISIIKFQQKNDLHSWNTQLHELEALIKQKPYLITSHLKIDLGVSQIKHLIAIQNYSKTYPIIHKLLDSTTFKSFNRFEVLEENFILLIQQELAQEAAQLIHEVYSSYQFSMLDILDRATWHIKSAYLFILQNINQNAYNPYGFPIFKLQDFYKDCAPISKDKTGYNLQFVIIKVILLYLKGSLEYESETNGLKVYYHRYLKNEAGLRTKSFFKALTHLTKLRFQQKEYERLSTELSTQLNCQNTATDYCEIVKYEKLWEYIGKMLQSN